MKLITFPSPIQSTVYTSGITVTQAMCAYHRVELMDSEIIKEVRQCVGAEICMQEIACFLNGVGINAEEETLSVEDVIHYIDNDTPPIIMIKAYGKFHYVIPIGYDDDRVFFMNPASFKTSYIKVDEFENRFYGLNRIGRIEKGISIVVNQKSSYSDNIYESIQK